MTRRLSSYRWHNRVAEAVDPTRIGCLGHSLGGHSAIFTTVFKLNAYTGEEY
jgi:predicted dienelactone hydrolase